ncbi:hypothetical protein AXW37_04640 [Yersinia ruckeri]|nr:hypothetical protein AXW19_04635 [Yersinia ruckeri]OIX35214.1 hypothetical protein AXW20_04630 [Yersinia ruckeri]OIX35500.1 hypothetical protein AXW18_04640 [Yersinia ruckeri]OIX44831.1 hypothetical protein AXW22_04645 [Yersinia ruckeri]OIX48293.1 hypothetical protein AXW21_04635 [Yersinia ruckeri]
MLISGVFIEIIFTGLGVFQALVYLDSALLLYRQCGFPLSTFVGGKIQISIRLCGAYGSSTLIIIALIGHYFFNNVLRHQFNIACTDNPAIIRV